MQSAYSTETNANKAVALIRTIKDTATKPEIFTAAIPPFKKDALIFTLSCGSIYHEKTLSRYVGFFI